jgi:predicted transcriptional regulator
LDYFWLLAAVWASFGALLTGAVFRRLDISRMSYREARQLLSAMVASLSTRIQRNELLVKELSDQLQTLAGNETRMRAEAGAADKERLLEYMQDWIANVKRFVEKVQILQKNLKDMESQFGELRLHVDRLEDSQRIGEDTKQVRVGMVTEQTLEKLTSTEQEVLELLLSGPKAAPEIGRLMIKSREHTARLMKLLFEQGFVERETERQPYQYRLNDKVREAMAPRVEQQATEPRR